MTAPAGYLTVPSLLILGTDAMLAAGPATPVQLAHACLAAGFHAVVPASWGDELIAARALERLREIDTPRVQCSCPHVARRLAEHGDAIAPLLLRFVPPPVATAQYVRAAYTPTRPHITYAGGCPSAGDETIDAWISAESLMGMLAERGIAASEQPTEFDSVLPPDRRRYFSEPGGVPSRHALRQLSTPIELVELSARDIVVDLAQHLLSGSHTLIDASVPLGCCCSGAVGSVSPDAARARVREHEPPRAPSPVVDHSLPLALDGMAPTGTRIANVVVPPPPSPADAPAPQAAPAAAVETVSRRRSPPGVTRPVLGATPVRRSEVGRQLPRAFVARRRSSPRAGMRQSLFRGTGPSRWDSPSRWLWVAIGGAIAAAVMLLVRLAL